MVSVKINGKEITVDDGTLILDAARDAGYEVPTFCYQADLAGIGSCRMCLVEIEGQKKLQPSCVTPVLHGMSILTESPNVMSARSSMLEFLLANHAMDCPVCDKGGECELQDMTYKYGPHKGRHAEPKFKFQEKDYILSPVIIKNSNRCVQCMKCVRVCREVVGANVLGSLGRGDHQEETSFLRSFMDCDQDGNCIEVCPVGCFMRLPFRYKTRPWDLKGADTICPYCGTGCRMVIEERDGAVVRARAQLGVGLNSETLCARGRFGYDIMNHPDRITTPLVRKFGQQEAVSWEEALNLVKEHLNYVNGGKIGGIASARLTNEELYLFQKVMREIFKSPNLDSSSRWDPSAVEGYIKATGMDEGGVSVFDCMADDALFIIGTQLSDENPVTDYIVRRISATRRMNVIIAYPRAMKLDSSANAALRHLPGAEGPLLNAVALALYNENQGKLAGNDAAKPIKDGNLDDLTAKAGVTKDQIAAITRRIGASNTVSIMAGTEFLRFPAGLTGLETFKNILKALCKKVRIMPVLDRPNQRGAWEMGVHPGFGPGYRETQKGMGCDSMLEAANRGELDVLYLAGTDCISMYPDEEFARTALSKVKFLIVEDTFPSEATKMAHVVLPGATFGEKDGAFTNQEGRVQSIRKLFNPRGKSKRDFDIIRSIGALFDSSYALMGVSGTFGEIKKEIESYAAVSLAFNNKRNIDNKLDNRQSLVNGFKAELRIPEFPSKTASVDREFPFMLVTGNHLFHSGRYSGKSDILLSLHHGAMVEISEEDAVSLGLADGDKVIVKGRHYAARLTLKTKKGSRRGVAFIGENFDTVPVNRFFRKGEGMQAVSITKTM